ncbi:DNA polymerase III subunit delta [Roseofilum sp. BLCC_M154]|uniref:DNA polymerase III subunit delta n=1 Tax=Roseofilum acuticapitatum BLCC-M154 TaxID=3022444 RepID=A0ABT7ARP3_9CYAN|nr:DNA polymerase III subunit delta [Roseofilum acuticapitatum]MDJ1169573.1 DNA polymerase III subunit delta [Roseofilum acuticapitatum BLCC-M154]
MPIYVYWGDDGFAMEQAVKQLRDRLLDRSWISFNYTEVLPDQPGSVMEALNQAMTPPFGSGNRLVWLVNTSLFQQTSGSLLAELERTLPVLLESSVLLLTVTGKPDQRLKVTKLLQKYAEFREFALIPPWKTDLLLQRVQEMASQEGVKLTQGGAEVLSQSVGNDTRRLVNELQKLALYHADGGVLSHQDVERLVVSNTQTSLELAQAIAKGEVDRSLSLIEGLLQRNEPALRVVATLVGQFRTWFWVKLMVESGERDDRQIAQAAEVNNPKRVYFLKKEVRSLPLTSLQQTLPLLLSLEWGLKQGKPEREILQSHIIQICQLYRKS